tara:strand:- start:773 stop:886 length:114 start_codon:yes stop_codon:yes gene_type:complete
MFESIPVVKGIKTQEKLQLKELKKFENIPADKGIGRM